MFCAFVIPQQVSIEVLEEPTMEFIGSVLKLWCRGEARVGLVC